MSLFENIFGKRLTAFFNKRLNALKTAEREMTELDRLTHQERELLAAMQKDVNGMLELTHSSKYETMVEHFRGIFQRAASELNINKRREIINKEINAYLQTEVIPVGSKFSDKPRELFFEHSRSYLKNYTNILEVLRKIQALGSEVVGDVKLAGAYA